MRAPTSSRIVLLPLVLLLLLLPLGGAVVADERLERSAAKQQSKIAKVWLDLGRYLVERGLSTQAGEALAKAHALDAELDGLAEVRGRLALLDGTGEMDASTEARIEKAERAAAKGYDKLAKVFAGEDGDARYVRALIQALLLDPSKARVTKIGGLAKKGLLLMGAPTHDAVAYVSFPKSWKPGREYPVLVSVDGAGANFKGNGSTFLGQRGARPFITIAPHALSCTNAINPKKFPAYDQALIDKWDSNRVAFDIAGLIALLDFLHEHFGAAEKVAITGFSGGGNLCYGLTLRHPDRVLCAAPACANFNPGLASGAPKVEGGGPRVAIMTGEKDPHRHLTHGKTPPGIEEQTDWAEKALGDAGFTNVTRTMLPGVGHSALPREVWKLVDEVVGDD